MTLTDSTVNGTQCLVKYSLLSSVQIIPKLATKPRPTEVSETLEMGKKFKVALNLHLR